MLWFVGLKAAGFLLVLIVERSHAESYRAAVVPYKPERHFDDLPDAIRARNERQYRQKIEEVKDKADIIIFPEYGLTTIEASLKPKQHLESYSVLVPDPEKNFHCNSNIPVDNVLLSISCVAKSNTMYVVYNVVEKAEENEVMNYYSTDIVFDSDGKLILKCRKKHLYNEINFSTGDLTEKCTFQATFKRRNNYNVTFGILFDTDIISPIPEDTPRDLILTSSLKNELPLSYGLSLQVAFSIRNKVNLLVSGYTDTDNFYGGSGIYLRNGKCRVTVNSDSVVTEEIPGSATMTQVNVQAPRWSVSLLNVPYQNISTLATTDANLSYTFEHEKDSYCKSVMNMNGNSDIRPYKWIAFNNNNMTYLGQQVHIVACALIKPEDKKNEKKMVNKVTISTVLSKDNVRQLLPFSLNSNMLPANFEFEEKDGNTTISLAQPDDLLTFGLVFVLNNGPPSLRSSVYIIHLVLLLYHIL